MGGERVAMNEDRSFYGIKRVDIRGHNLLKRELPSDTERVQLAPIYWRYFSKRRKFSKKHLLIKSKKVSSPKAPQIRGMAIFLILWIQLRFKITHINHETNYFVNAFLVF